ncbi:MAG: thioredoxin-disulfide reductase [Dehalococcoidales bacterium]|nr:thioredoxin-disulfide reductase [Dehalococcoidales bacterium]
MSELPLYEVIIIGAGPAGLSAGIYTARGRLKSLLIERGLFGGQINNTERIENYPGFPEGIDGLELGRLMLEQARKYGLETVTAEATGIELQGERKIVKTTEGNFEARALIIAGGSQRQKLGVPGEEEFTGRGVSYCATCDAAFFRDQPVAVVGGGNAAVSEALHLARFASKVTLIHRRSELRASPILQERVLAEPKIQFLWNTTVEAIEGEKFVRKLQLNQTETGGESTLEVAGVFVSIGFKPDTDYLRGILPLDKDGHIVTNEKMETTVPNIMAAGDIRANSARQAIAAAGDGATAAVYIERSLHEK